MQPVIGNLKKVLRVGKLNSQHHERFQGLRLRFLPQGIKLFDLGTNSCRTYDSQEQGSELEYDYSQAISVQNAAITPLQGKENKDNESFLEDDDHTNESSEDKSDDEDKEDKESDDDDDDDKRGGLLIPIYELIKGFFPRLAKQPQNQGE